MANPMPRRLDPEESALWARVSSTVRPLRRKAGPSPLPGPPPALPSRVQGSPPPAFQPRPAPPASRPAPVNTLDGSWDRRISSGRVTPDVIVDLHGHNLTSAHATLERKLGEAVARENRVMLVITGHPPRRGRPEQNAERPRGLIRQQLPYWLAASSHRDAIAAVRGAHPRHGGGGALYLILRRRRENFAGP